MDNKIISLNEAINEIESIVDTMSVCVSTDECKGMRRMKKSVLERISALSPVDAVPVQRCDGCRYADWHSNGCIAYCTKHGSDGHVADSFCSEGEKDGDND